MKFFIVAFLLTLYFLLTFPFYPLYLIAPMKARFILKKIVSQISTFILYVLNVEIDIFGQPPQGNHLLVCNHQSYLDVLIIASRIETLFVTSLEMKKTFFLGQVSSLAGCVFIDRRSKKNLKKEIKSMNDALNYHNVLIFPEGTATNGEGILPFKKPLFSSAYFSKSPVTPICLNYESIEDEKVTHKNRDVVCWYADMNFLTHFFRLSQKKKIKVSLTFGDPKYIESAEDDREFARKMSEECHKWCKNNFKPLRDGDKTSSLFNFEYFAQVSKKKKSLK